MGVTRQDGQDHLDSIVALSPGLAGKIRGGIIQEMLDRFYDTFGEDKTDELDLNDPAEKALYDLRWLSHFALYESWIEKFGSLANIRN